MSINITAAEVTNLYLYGQSTTPANLADVSVLSHQAPAPLSFDVDQYMTLGAGRFGKPSQFAMINWFMENSVLGEIGVETRYTLAELVSLTGASLRERVTQAFYDDGSDDVVQRTYIWNTTHFVLVDATFVMSADGTRWIENLKIKPENENFDFKGGWVSELASYALGIEFGVDPYSIGVKVGMEYQGGPFTYETYTTSQHQSDIAYISNSYHPGFNFVEAISSSLLQDLFDQGISNR